jgi:hypothetical protein
MWIVAALLVASGCSHQPIGLKQAEALVLRASGITQAVAARGARPAFEWIGIGPDGWRFDVNARNRCATPGPCSKLLGHFAVNRWTAQVEDLDAAGGEGALVSDSELTRLRDAFLRSRCRASARARPLASIARSVQPASIPRNRNLA